MARNGLSITLGQLKGALKGLEKPVQELGTVASTYNEAIGKLADSLGKLATASKNFKGVTIDSATIEKAIPVFSDDFKNNISNLENIASKFSDLSTVLKGLSDSATTVSLMAENFKKLKDSLIEMKDLAGELSGSTITMTSDGKVQPPIFKSFSKLVDAVNDAVKDETKLNKFQDTAKALRSFSMGLKDITSIDFDAFNGFLTKMSTPDTKGGYDTPFTKFIELVSAYVNMVGALGARSQDISSGSENINKTKTALNPSIQGIKDIFSTIKELAKDLVGLASNDAQYGLNALQTVKDRLIAFITRLSAFSVIGFETRKVKGVETIVPILSDKVRGFVALVDTLTPLVKLLPKVSLVEEARDNLIKTRDAILSFITGFAMEESTAIATLNTVTKQDSVSTYTGFLNGIKNGLTVLSVIVSEINKLARSIAKVNLVEDARKNLIETQKAIISFVKGFYESDVHSIVLYGNYSANSVSMYQSVLIGIRNGIQVISEITTVLGRLSSAVLKISLVEEARNNLIRTKRAIIDFVKEFSFDSEHSFVPVLNNSKYVTFLGSLKGGLNVILAISDVFSTFSRATLKVSSIYKSKDLLIASRKAIIDFIRGFYDQDNRLPVVIGSFYESVADSLYKGLSIINTLSNLFNKFSRSIEKLISIKSITVRFALTRKAIIDFIKSFYLDDVTLPVVSNSNFIYTTLVNSIRYGLSVMDIISKMFVKLSNSISRILVVEDTKDKLKATKQTIIDFIKGFYYGDETLPVSFGSSSYSTILQLLNNGLSVINEISQVFVRLSNAVSKVTLVEDARVSFINTRNTIIDFVKGFYISTETLPVPVDFKGGYTTILESLRNGLSVMDAISKMFNRVSSSISKISLTDEMKNRFMETKQTIIDFIKGFFVGEETLPVPVDFKGGYTTILESLRNGLSVMDAISKMFNKLSNSLAQIQLTDEAKEKLKATRGSIFEFIKGFVPDQATIESLVLGLKNITVISSLLNKLSTVLNSLSKLSSMEFKTTGTTLFDFIRTFIPDPSIANDILVGLKNITVLSLLLDKFSVVMKSINKIGSVQLTFTGDVLFKFIRSFIPDASISNDIVLGLKNMTAISMVLDKYSSVLKTLNKISAVAGVTFHWSEMKESVFKFIKSFIPDASVSEDIVQGLKNMLAISKILEKYASIIKAMNKIGPVNTSTWNTAKEELVKFIESFVNDPALEGLAKDAVKRFSSIGNSLRGIATFINSIGKNKLGEGLTKLEGAKDKIRQFIESMAELKNNTAFPDFERVANAVGSFNGRLHDATKTVERSNQSFTKLKSIMRQIYTAFVGGAVIYSIVRSIKSAIKEVYDLEYAMARVNTIARVSSNELKNMTHFVQNVSSEFGIASSKISKALYDINSATIKGSASLKILEQSAKLAVAGFTDIDKVTNLIARAVNAYEYSVSEAAKISDILFVTIERGINPMEELSEYMGRLFTVSANAGVSLEEVGAGLATLTARGYQTNVASTALNAAILKLSTGTKELNKLFQQYGYASSASALRTIGLTGALQVLYKATNGATEKLHDLGFNYRDIRAATTLASGAIDEYNKTLALMNDETYKAGLTNKAYSEVQDTLIFKINRLKETYTVLIQSVSEYMNKNATIKSFIDLLTEGIENLTKSIQGFNVTLKEQLSIGLVTFIPKVVLAYGVLKAFPKILLAIKTGFAGVNGATKLWGVSLKGLGGAFATSLTVINALLSFFKDLAYIIESGTLITGLKAVFTTAEGALSALAGAVGRFIDYITFTSTNFGEKWSQYFLRPDYTPKEGESTAEGFTEQEGLFRSKVAELNSPFIHKGLSEFDYSTENIEAEFNKIMTSLQNYADSLKLNKEFVNENTKEVRKAFDEKMKENNAVLALTPNMKALADVFEEVSKKLKENAEKQSDALEKAASASIKAQFGFDAIAKETGLSLKQVKNAFSSDLNLSDFREMLKVTPAMFTEAIESGLVLPKNLQDDKDRTEAIARFMEMRASYFGEDIQEAIKFLNFGFGDTSNIITELKNFQKAFSESDFITAAKLLRSSSGLQTHLASALGLDPYQSWLTKPLEDKPEERLKRVFDAIENNVKLPEYAKNKFEDLRTSEKTFKDLANVTDFDKIANYVADALQLSPEVRRAMSELGSVMPNTVDKTLELAKACTKLGYDINKITPQISIDEIVGNVFGLSEVSMLKESLRDKLVKPSGLENFDNAIVDSLLSNVIESIGANTPVEEINSMIIKELNDLNLGLSGEQLEDVGSSIYAIASRIVKISSDFVNQFSELDFAKTMNKLKFGSELSVFKQYQQVGKKMIESVYNRTIEGIKFGSLLSEFETNKEEVGFNQARLMFIEKFGKTGEAAWNTFIDAFKDLGNYTQQFISPLNTEFRNLKKRGLNFIKNYKDSMLSPIEQFNKTQALLNRQLSRISRQAKSGELKPESIKNAMDTIDKLYKLNEETMNIKVPAAITASEAVRTGSKEAFDLVARNVFKDTYKVNVRQEKLQKSLVDDMKTLVRLANQGSKNVSESITLP